ncbi:MAG: hypothetical protein QOD32_19 [Pyrinomonadaceae bacterium]|jgi:hypothetical protein|nr:hypothetical protein [Pyrinomonadaceae bacterium]
MIARNQGVNLPGAEGVGTRDAAASSRLDKARGFCYSLASLGRALPAHARDSSQLRVPSRIDPGDKRFGSQR